MGLRDWISGRQRVDVPDIVKIAQDAIQSGEAASVCIVSPFMERRDFLRWVVASELETLGADGVTTIQVRGRDDASPADLTLEDDTPPAWASAAEEIVIMARRLGQHPIDVVQNVKRERLLNFTDLEFAQWLRTSAHRDSKT